MTVVGIPSFFRNMIRICRDVVNFYQVTENWMYVTIQYLIDNITMD